jgi:hypothetical protein
MPARAELRMNVETKEGRQCGHRNEARGAVKTGSTSDVGDVGVDAEDDWGEKDDVSSSGVPGYQKT